MIFSLFNPAKSEKIIEMTQSSSKLVYTSLPENDPMRRRPDISLADKMLGWDPTVELDEGLVYTIDYFSKIIYSSILDETPERTNNTLKNEYQNQFD